MMTSLKTSFTYWIAVLAIACLPVIFLTLYTAREFNLHDFTFAINDEVSYFHQVLTFKAAGFNGGYYTLFEEPAAAAFTHFYTYGPWFPITYGLIARITGWDLYSFLIVNGLVMMMSIVGFCWMIRLNKWQLILLALALITSYTLMLYLFTGFQEAFQQALAIGMSAHFAIAFQQREKTRPVYKITGIFLIAFAGLTRASWCLLLFPFLLLISQRKLVPLLISVIIAGAVSLSIYWIWGKVGAPGNNLIAEALYGFNLSLRKGVTRLIERASQNIQWLFDPQDEYSASQRILYLLQNIQIIGLSLAALIMAAITWLRRKQFNEILDWLFHAYNLIAILALTLLLYVTRYRGDYRVFAPHLTVSLLLLIGMKRYRVAAILIGFSLLFFPAYLSSQVESNQAHFNTETRQAYEDFQMASSSVIQYDPSAPNAWCNTLYFYVEDYATEIAGAPAGIGLTFYFPGNLKNAYMRSKYLLLDAKDYNAVQERAKVPILTKLADTKLGTLYRNENSACTTSPTD